MFKRIASTILFLTVAVGLAFGAKTVFIDGTPALGIKGTKVTAAYLNAVNKRFCTGLDTDGDCSLAYSTATGTNDLVTTISPTTAFPAAYVNGMPLYIKTAATNTGAMTINVNGLGAKAIKTNGTENLVSENIKAGQIIEIAYDGTNFQLMSQPYKAYFTTELSTSGTSTNPLTIDMGSIIAGELYLVEAYYAIQFSSTSTPNFIDITLFVDSPTGSATHSFVNATVLDCTKHRYDNAVVTDKAMRTTMNGILSITGSGTKTMRVGVTETLSNIAASGFGRFMKLKISRLK